MALYKNNKQDGSTILIAGVGGENINVDSTLDSTSMNPVQNKIITEQFDIIDKIFFRLGKNNPRKAIYNLIPDDNIKIVCTYYLMIHLVEKSNYRGD